MIRKIIRIDENKCNGCGTTLTLAPAPCPFSAENRSCLGAQCPFFGGRGISD